MADFNTALGGETAPVSGGLNVLLKQSLDSQASAEKKYEEKVEPIVKELESTKPPEIPTLPSAPKPEFKNQMESFGSAANWMAIFGSMLTRRPLVNALKSSAGVMNAYHAQDLEKYKQQFDAWKQNVDNVVQLHDFERQSYNDLVGKDEKLASIYANQFKNPTLGQMAQFKMVENYLDTHDEKGNSIKNNAEKLRAIEEQADQWKAEHPNATDEEYLKYHAGLMHDAFMGNTAGGVPTWTPDAIDVAAQAVAEGVPLSKAVPGFGKNNPNRDAVWNRAVELNPTLNLANAEADFAGKISEARKVGTQAGGIILAANILDNSIPSMLQSAEKLGLSNFTDWNTLVNTAKRHMSDQDYTNFSTQLRAVASDYAQLIGRGRQTVHSDEEALKILNDSMGTRALSGFADAVKVEKQNLLAGVKETQNRGKTPETSDTPPVNLLKKGTITTFSDGSEWTLLNGNPSKVK